MSIYNKLQEVLKEAMRNKNEDKKNYIRSIKARLTEHQVANNMARDVQPSDEVVVDVISSYKKSLQKAMKQLQTGSGQGDELIREYEGEVKFCEQFLPNVKDIDMGPIIDEAISAAGHNLGKVMSHIMKNHKGLDGGLVKREVIKRLG